MRKTKYATELAHVAVPDGSDEARMELLRMRESGAEEIRLSWWREGRRMIPRPLDVPEPLLVELITRAAREGVLSPAAVAQLRSALAAEHTE